MLAATNPTVDRARPSRFNAANIRQVCPRPGTGMITVLTTNVPRAHRVQWRTTEASTSRTTGKEGDNKLSHEYRLAR